MKTTIKNAVLLILVCSLASACNDNLNEDRISQLEEFCAEGQAKDQQCFRITESDALSSINLYLDNITNVQSSLDSSYAPIQVTKENLLNYGAKVNVEELKRVLSYVENTGGDELYLINSVRPVRDENRRLLGHNASEPIFVLSAAAIGNKSPGQNFYYYFDFMQPCPAACPDLPGIEFTGAFN